jgi:hypothetical protein
VPPGSAPHIINKFPKLIPFKVNWGGVIKRAKVRNEAAGFAGPFVVTHATMTYTASVPAHGFTFVSDPASTSKEVYAEIGHEHNGSFFPSGDDDG